MTSRWNMFDMRYNDLGSPRKRKATVCEMDQLRGQNIDQKCSYTQDDIQGLIQLEGWNQDETVDADLNSDFFRYGRILEKILEYVSPTDQQNCRRVCHHWNHAVNRLWERDLVCIWSPGRIASLLQLIRNSKNMDMKFPFRNLGIIGSGEFEVQTFSKMDSHYLIELFEEMGESLLTLAISMEFKYYPFLFLPTWCPNIQALDLGCTMDFASFPESFPEFIPQVLQASWRNGFPSLKHLEIQQCENRNYPPDAPPPPSDQVFGNLLKLLLDSPNDIMTLILPTFTWPAMEIVSSFLTQRPGLMKRIQNLEINVDETVLQRLIKMELYLKNLVVLKLADDVSTATFSKILKCNSNTLFRLDIKKCCSPAEDQPFQVNVPCEMKMLEHIRLLGAVLSIQSGDSTLMKRLPKIKHLSVCIYSGIRCHQQHFWQEMFPLEQEELMERPNLRCFQVYVPLEDQRLLHEIKARFPGLTVLELQIDGNLLPALIHGLKDLKIQDFSLTYMGTDRGILAFDSALTGIAEEECTKLLQDEKETYRHQHLKLDKLKIRSSLGDWKCLHRLELVYCKIGNSKVEKLDRVTVSQGLLQATTIRIMTLGGFEIDERLIQRMLKKFPLKIFLLGGCHIICHCHSVVVRDLSVCDNVKMQFPAVRFDDDDDDSDDDD